MAAVASSFVGRAELEVSEPDGPEREPHPARSPLASNDAMIALEVVRRIIFPVRATLYINSIGGVRMGTEPSSVHVACPTCLPRERCVL